jgi:WD40 repeat protein
MTRLSFSDGSIRLWDAAAGKSVGRIETKLDGLSSFSFSADGKTVFAVPWRPGEKGLIHAHQVSGGSATTMEMAEAVVAALA